MSATYNTRDRIANIGAGMVPTYHATESVDEANAVVEQCATATERLRELLDERGVEYEVDDAKTVRVTRWGAYGDWVSFIEYDNGDTKFCIDARRLTPEQAISATLGPEDAYTREDVEGAFVSGYSLGLDMYDRTKPDADKGWNQNECDMDEEMGERGWVRDRGTCLLHDCDGSFSSVSRPVWRCDCGAFMTQYTDATTYHKPRFCPNCGRKRVDE